MALLTKKEFAQKCGVPTNYLSVYIQRGNIVLSDGLIDDTLQANVYFHLKKTKENPVQKSEELTPPPKPINVKAKPRKISDEKEFTGQSKFNQDIETREAELEKKRVEIRLALLKEQKLMGELIPTDLIKSFFILHSESIKVSFNEGCENLIVIISQQKQLSNTEVAEVRKKLVDIINLSIDNAISSSKKNLTNIVKEYSERRGIGEKN